MRRHCTQQILHLVIPDLGTNPDSRGTFQGPPVLPASMWRQLCCKLCTLAVTAKILASRPWRSASLTTSNWSCQRQKEIEKQADGRHKRGTHIWEGNIHTHLKIWGSPTLHRVQEDNGRVLLSSVQSSTCFLKKLQERTS